MTQMPKSGRRCGVDEMDHGGRLRREMAKDGGMKMRVS
jgi:hypothetical protein